MGNAGKFSIKSSLQLNLTASDHILACGDGDVNLRWRAWCSWIRAGSGRAGPACGCSCSCSWTEETWPACSYSCSPERPADQGSCGGFHTRFLWDSERGRVSLTPVTIQHTFTILELYFHCLQQLQNTYFSRIEVLSEHWWRLMEMPWISLSSIIPYKKK